MATKYVYVTREARQERGADMTWDRLIGDLITAKRKRHGQAQGKAGPAQA